LLSLPKNAFDSQELGANRSSGWRSSQVGLRKKVWKERKIWVRGYILIWKRAGVTSYCKKNLPGD
jgi:hypothetical protein